MIHEIWEILENGLPSPHTNDVLIRLQKIFSIAEEENLDIAKYSEEILCNADDWASKAMEGIRERYDKDVELYGKVRVLIAQYKNRKE